MEQPSSLKTASTNGESIKRLLFRRVPRQRARHGGLSRRRRRSEHDQNHAQSAKPQRGWPHQSHPGDENRRCGRLEPSFAPHSLGSSHLASVMASPNMSWVEAEASFFETPTTSGVSKRVGPRTMTLKYAICGVGDRPSPLALG